MPTYQSYPPSLYGLPVSHDLKLVGTPVPGTLQVDFTWDSQGKAATLSYGDGQSLTSSAGVAAHTYAVHQVYTASVRSGAATDSAVLDLTAALLEADPEPEPEPEPEPDPTEDEPAEADGLVDPTYEAESP
jgi:hypothetical protein